MIADLESHGDDEPQCQCIEDGSRCTEPATFVSVCTLCGGQSGLMCTRHANDIPNIPPWMQHLACGRSAPLCVLLRVVPL